jgi:hypothetical protein
MKSFAEIISSERQKLKMRLNSEPSSAVGGLAQSNLLGQLLNRSINS